MLLLNAAEVRSALPMVDAIEVMRQTMAAHGRGEAFQPARMVAHPPGIPGSLMLKPGAVPDGFGLKALTIFPENGRLGLDSIQAFVALFDPATGLLQAVIEGGVVTEIRTAAVSAVSTDVLARPDAGDLAILGAGVQARGHLLAMAAVRPLRRVRIWNRTTEHAETLAGWAAELDIRVEVCTSVRAAVENADLICTVTASEHPLLAADWIRDGAHLNAVGAYRADMRELPAELLTRAGVVAVDSREGALADAGDLVLARSDGLLPKDFDPPEVGELLVGSRQGRTTPEEVTIFESLGLAIQDVAAATFVRHRALELGLGTEVAFPS